MISQVDICCGLAWGDEAKGKIVAELLRKKKYDWVARWSGGSNAGHTIYFEGAKFATHIVPAGVFFGIPCYIGPDCYLNLKDFDKEMEYLKSHHLDTSLVYLSPKVHIITDYHQTEDSRTHQKTQGSTGKGIAPCAGDKFYRHGVRLEEITDTLKDKYVKHIWDDKVRVSPLWGNVLCEGAQGFWLDINFGNYPYVTSSTTLPYSACSLGFPPQKIRDIYGAVKIYDTRVGTDPDFDNLADDPLLKKIAEVGQEYGSTTGRLRKVNWLNLDKLENAINISGTTHVIISKVDILEKVGVFQFLYLGKTFKFNSLSEMTEQLSGFITSNCPLVKNIIYSDNPYSIEGL